MRFLLLIVFSFSAFANDGDEWERQELSASTKAQTIIFQDSIADALFFGSNWHLIPIQHIGENAHGKFSEQSEALKKRIFDHLGVNKKTAKPHALGINTFYTGARKNLVARSYEVNWINSLGSSLVTCVVVVKDRQKIHVVFLESAEFQLPDCAKKLKTLTDDPILYQ